MSRFGFSHRGLFVAAVLGAGTCALAQTVTGSVNGTVTDPSGAVIPNAQVSVRNVDTGVVTPTTTNGAGLYSVRFLPVGRYTVTIEATGFATQTVPPFALEVNQTAKIDGKLTTGSSQTTVDVSTVAPILNTNDASLGITLDNQAIQNLPLNGRNFSSVTLFQPGAINTDPTALTGNNAIERNTYNSGIVSMNGNRNQANNYTLDGADLNEGQNNLIGYNPAPDSLQEVHVVSANAPAQFGNANGGAVLSVLKTGTNQFHGSAYGYLENYNLDANTWANKHQEPTADANGNLVANPIAKNPFTQSIFGGTLGGPILRNRLFFFVDYEGTRRHTGGQQSASVLPAEFRTGDFSSLLTQASPIQLYDSQNNFRPFARNHVPVTNPVAQFLFAHPELYPLPNAGVASGVFMGNYRGAQRSFVVNNQGDVKIQYNLGQRNVFTAFYSQSDAYDTQTALIPVFFPAQNVYPTKLGGGSWIHTFSPAVVNEARFGFTRIRWDNSIPTDPSGVFGYGGNALVGIPFGTQNYVGFSGQSIGGDASYVGTNANIQVLRDNTFNYYDNLTWQRGRHLISFGGQATRYQQNYINSSNYGFLGQFNYSGSFTGLPGGGGYAPADFVSDRVSQTSLGSSFGLVGNRQWRVAGYVQDDWRASDKLTLNFGVRYEYDEPWREANNKTANVDLATGQVIYAGSVPAGAVAGAGVCPTTACYNANYTQIMPRLGFAYQALPKLVIRGGYGATSFFEGDASNQRLTSSPPFALGSQLNALTPSATSAGTPFSVEQGFTPQFAATSQYSVWPQNQQPAYIHNFSLTTEYALTSSTSIQLTYLGESGHHLADYRNANQLTLAQAQLIATIPNGGNLTAAELPAAARTPYNALVGQFGNLLVTESAAMMNYNGGQATIRQRTSHGLDFAFNYTYARAMTTSSGNYGTPNIAGSNGAFQDGYNQSADYGPAGQDVRHSLNGYVVYALPVGRGQAFGNHMNRFLDLAVGGWKGSATIVAYSGLPVTINMSGTPSNTNTFGQHRANFYHHIRVQNRGNNNWYGTGSSVNAPETITVTNEDGTTAQQVVNACTRPEAQSFGCAYGPSAALTFGTSSIGSERAPGYLQSDMSAFKDFNISERQSIGFRSDFFNVFNIASYGNPDNTITDSNFGQITGVRSGPRQIQFSAHYQF